MKHAIHRQKKKLMQFGNIIFGVGIVLAILSAFIVPTLDSATGKSFLRAVVALLIILSILVGFFNITVGEASSFLIASIVVVMLSQPFLQTLDATFQVSSVEYLAKVLGGMFRNIVIFIVPAAVIVALRTFIQTAKDE